MLSGYKGTYTQIISPHEKGLLISQEDVSVEPLSPNTNGGKQQTAMQLALLEINGVINTTLPDLVIDSAGKLVEVFQSNLLGNRIKSNIEQNGSLSLSPVLKEFIAQIPDQFNRPEVSEELGKQEWAEATQWNQLVLEKGTPIQTTYSSAQLKNSSGMPAVNGTLTYEKSMACEIQSSSICALLSFKAETTDLRMKVLQENKEQASSEENRNDDIQLQVLLIVDASTLELYRQELLLTTTQTLTSAGNMASEKRIRYVKEVSYDR